MSFERKRQSTHPDFNKALTEVQKVRKRRINTVLTESVHIKLKMIAATEKTTVSDILDDLAKKYISEYGIIRS